MRHRGFGSRVPGSLALALSMMAFVLGTAPFTPAMALSVMALPLAVLSYYLGARNLAILTCYWITASFLVIPVSRTMHFRIDYLLVLFGIGGLVLTVILYVIYSRRNIIV
jgi:hypothetical protein